MEDVPSPVARSRPFHVEDLIFMIVECPHAEQADRMDRLRSRIHPALKILIGEGFNENIDRQSVTVTMNTPMPPPTIVETHADEAIIWAKRVGKKWHSRFVKRESGKMTPTFELTLELRRLVSDPTRRRWDVLDIYTGPPVPPEPNGNGRRKTSHNKEYWRKHAFLYGSVEIEPDSELSDAEYSKVEPGKR